MSTATPKKGNFLQTFVIVTTLYLGFYLFILKPQQDQQAVQPQNIGALHQALLTDNKSILDVSIVRDASTYNSAVSDQVKKKLMTQADADQRKVEATVLVANTQWRAGLLRKESSRTRNAYMTLRGIKNQFKDTPLWTTPVPVNSDPRFPGGSSWTPDSMSQQVFTDLSEQNRHELTYGVFPGYQIIDAFVAVTGHAPAFSYAFACFLLALIVRGVVYPLMERQLKFSRQMQQLLPLTKEIKEQYKEDPAEQQKKVMELYKRYGINPLAGCFPAFLQLPLFLSVYQFMLHYQFAFQAGTFLWINPHTATLTHGWTAPNLGEQDFVLIFIYAVSMVVSTLLAPVSDPTQMRQQRMMSLSVGLIWPVFMFFMPLPSAFVLYWTFTNVLSTLQSIRAYRRPLPPLQEVNAPGGGVLPKSGLSGKWMQMMEEMQAGASGTNGAKPKSGQVILNQEVKTGSPVKHKPKKRK